MPDHSRPPSGWKGLVETGTGAPLEIHPWETVVFENAGLYIYHNDKYETTTFLPVFTVRMVRWHDAAREKDGSNVGGEVMVGRRQHPSTNIREIGQ